MVLDTLPAQGAIISLYPSLREVTSAYDRAVEEKEKDSYEQNPFLQAQYREHVMETHEKKIANIGSEIADLLLKISTNATFLGFKDLGIMCKRVASVYDANTPTPDLQGYANPTNHLNVASPPTILIESGPPTKTLENIANEFHKLGRNIEASFLKTSEETLKLPPKDTNPFPHSYCSDTSAADMEKEIKLMLLMSSLLPHLIPEVYAVVTKKDALGVELPIGYLMEFLPNADGVNFLMSENLIVTLGVLDRISYVLNTLHANQLTHNDTGGFFTEWKKAHEWTRRLHFHNVWLALTAEMGVYDVMVKLIDPGVPFYNDLSLDINREVGFFHLMLLRTLEAFAGGHFVYKEVDSSAHWLSSDESSAP